MPTLRQTPKRSPGRKPAARKSKKSPPPKKKPAPEPRGAPDDEPTRRLNLISRAMKEGGPLPDFGDEEDNPSTWGDP